MQYKNIKSSKGLFIFYINKARTSNCIKFKQVIMAKDTIGNVNAVVSEDPNNLRYVIPYKEYIVHLQDQVKSSDSVLHVRENELQKCQNEVREMDKTLSSNSILPFLTNPYGVLLVGIVALVILFVLNSKRTIKIGKGDVNVSIESQQSSHEDKDK